MSSFLLTIFIAVLFVITVTLAAVTVWLALSVLQLQKKIEGMEEKSSPLPPSPRGGGAGYAADPAQNFSPSGGGREGAGGREEAVSHEAATTIFLPQNQDDLFVSFATTVQPGSIFKATVSPDGRTASYEPLTINFLQCNDHFKAISLTADSCLTEEATTFETVAPGTIEKATEAGHTFWEIKQRATVRLGK